MDSNVPTRAGRYQEIFQLSWPIIVANSAVPLLGLADTAVIGNTGTAIDLGAIALGVLVFNFLYWTFGFLRMGTTGLTAQASGAWTPSPRASTMLEILSVRIPGAELVSISGAGHLVNVEPPAQFNEALTSFLRTGSPAEFRTGSSATASLRPPDTRPSSGRPEPLDVATARC